MHEPVDDPVIARAAAELRRSVPLSPDFDARVMGAVRRATPAWPVRAWRWVREPRAVAVSPLGGLAMAAGMAGLLLVGTWRGETPEVRGLRPEANRQATDLGPQASVVTFVLLVPEARTVSLAGDFNGWDPALSPMRRGEAGLWTVEVPLEPGRYQYAFVVDGSRFVADPSAPRAVGDDFGTPTSVVTVGGGAVRSAGGAL